MSNPEDDITDTLKIPVDDKIKVIIEHRQVLEDALEKMRVDTVAYISFDLNRPVVLLALSRPVFALMQATIARQIAECDQYLEEKKKLS